MAYKWDEMTSRERDALVAEKVMGWTKKTFPGAGGGYTVWLDAYGHNTGWLESDATLQSIDRIWQPSTDIRAAWEVVDQIQQLGWNMELMNAYMVPEIGRQWGCDLRDGRNCSIGYAPTAPEAICLAALKAVGVDIE